MRRRLFAFTLALAVGGACGLLGNMAPLAFQLPRRTFVLSTDDSQWQAPPQTFATALDCGGRDDCCMPPGGQALSCTQFPFVCESGQCAVTFPLELVAVVDLGHDAPEVAQARGQVPAEVTLESVDYTVTSELNVALPAVTLYVAPQDVASASDSKARRLGVIPLTNAGFQGGGTVTLDPEAQRAFEALARDLQTPFHLIASATITIRSGSPRPMGRVELSVTGRVTAKF